MPDTSLQYLDSLTMHGVKLGLANIRAMLAAAGDPQNAYPTIHVGGTNGKGSTVALLNAFFIAAGYRVGRFTSPHLIRLNERFQINGEQIADQDLEDEIEFFRAIADGRDYPPTFFELNTAVAFRHFARQRVDIALIEVGLGGRLDSTNVITPIATAVTNIDLEHTQYLGDTLEEIAFEKAGIFKNGVPAIIGETKPGPRGVLAARARHEHAPAFLLDRDFSFTLAGEPLAQRISYQGPIFNINDAPLGLNGRYQGQNAAIAIAVAEQCRDAFPRIDEAAIRHGLAHATWPCRMERVREHPPVYIDVAHNPAGAARLAEHFSRCVLLLAVSSDKDAPAMLRHLAPMAEHIIVTAYDGPRAMPINTLAAHAAHAAPGTPVRVAANMHEALRCALPLARPEAPLLITGSIYLAGEARVALGYP